MFQSGKSTPYFEGWYFKQQNRNDTVAFIPSRHMDENGRRWASLQMITDQDCYSREFSTDSFCTSGKQLCIRIGDSVFTGHGCRLDCQFDGTPVKGILRYSAFTPPVYDIMGPFRFVPGMQCRHSVFSLWHQVDGWLRIGGREIRFSHKTGGTGYVEGDRGCSFPQRYLWTQCSFPQGSIMLSVADIPYGGMSFTGCIASVFMNGREYRLATYCGAKPVHISPSLAVIRQGEFLLSAQLLEGSPLPLRAPVRGQMIRTILESASCRVQYRLCNRKKILLEFTSDQASFESEWRPF